MISGASDSLQESVNEGLSNRPEKGKAMVFECALKQLRGGAIPRRFAISQFTSFFYNN